MLLISLEVRFEVISWLPTCCTALTSLTLSKLCYGNYQNVKFPALKKLQLERVGEGDTNEWNDLVMSNRTIESLSLKCFLNENENDVKKLFGPYLMKMYEALPNLKYLILRHFTSVNMYIFQTIVGKCNNMESFWNVVNEKKNEGMMSMRKGLKYELVFYSYDYQTPQPFWQN